MAPESPGVLMSKPRPDKVYPAHLLEEAVSRARLWWIRRLLLSTNHKYHCHFRPSQNSSMTYDQRNCGLKYTHLSRSDIRITLLILEKLLQSKLS
ncbi:MAG: hypothetical protein IPP49_12125 [Saprospiraceae bacterium]|nr:hypothetical protein [Saprospiraceae bacterium]